MENFSSRKGLTAFDAPITVREGAPTEVRQAVAEFAADAGVDPDDLRTTVVQILGVPPQPQRWSKPEYVLDEVKDHLENSKWFEVYDIAELFFDQIAEHDPTDAEEYATRLNRLFKRLGVGWKIAQGVIEARGSENFELQVRRAQDALESSDFANAQRELHEALLDLSRRPKADLTGAVQHAAAALECVAREAAGNPKLRFGDIVKKYPSLFPPPIDQALEKIWGFSCERARHIREGRSLAPEEVELVVSISAASVTYLVEKLQLPAG